jgi:hypothetical protein
MTSEGPHETGHEPAQAAHNVVRGAASVPGRPEDEAHASDFSPPQGFPPVQSFPTSPAFPPAQSFPPPPSPREFSSAQDFPPAQDFPASPAFPPAQGFPPSAPPAPAYPPPAPPSAGPQADDRFSAERFGADTFRDDRPRAEDPYTPASFPGFTPSQSERDPAPGNDSYPGAFPPAEPLRGFPGGDSAPGFADRAPGFPERTSGGFPERGPAGYSEPSAGYSEPSASYSEPSAGFSEPPAGFSEPSAGFSGPAAGFPPPEPPRRDGPRHGAFDRDDNASPPGDRWSDDDQNDDGSAYSDYSEPAFLPRRTPADPTSMPQARDEEFPPTPAPAAIYPPESERPSSNGFAAYPPPPPADRGMAPAQGMDHGFDRGPDRERPDVPAYAAQVPQQRPPAEPPSGRVVSASASVPAGSRMSPTDGPAQALPQALASPRSRVYGSPAPGAGTGTGSPIPTSPAVSAPPPASHGAPPPHPGYGPPAEPGGFTPPSGHEAYGPTGDAYAPPAPPPGFGPQAPPPAFGHAGPPPFAPPSSPPAPPGDFGRPVSPAGPEFGERPPSGPPPGFGGPPPGSNFGEPPSGPPPGFGGPPPGSNFGEPPSGAIRASAAPVAPATGPPAGPGPSGFPEGPGPFGPPPGFPPGRPDSHPAGPPPGPHQAGPHGGRFPGAPGPGAPEWDAQDQGWQAPEQGRFDNFRPDTKDAEPEPVPQVRNGRVLLAVLTGAALLLILPFLIVWAVTRSSGDASFEVGSCVKQSGTKAVAADCSEAGAFKVVSKVANKADCPDPTQPAATLPGNQGKESVLCLGPVTSG